MRPGKPYLVGALVVCHRLDGAIDQRKEWLALRGGKAMNERLRVL
jgi:hypothetical protein